MAFNVFPTTEKELTKIVKDDKVRTELTKLLSFLNKKFPTIKDPIAIDPSIKNIVKVTRRLQYEITLNELKRVSNLTIKFGEGSRGNRGSNNRGLAYENIFIEQFRQWLAGEQIDTKAASVIEKIYKDYKLNLLDSSEIVIRADGSNNTKRPLLFQNNSVYIGSTFKDIGKEVSDVTLLHKNKDIIYFSLKHGNLVSFFNVGIAKILSKNEIQAGQIENKDGLALLQLFNIDQEKFCKVFTDGHSERIDVTHKVNKSKLEDFIQSGIGYGYHMIHKKPSSIISFAVDKKYAQKSSKIEKVVVYYGGKTGTAKRMHIEITTSQYYLSVMIRSTDGNSLGMPTHITCEYKYKNNN